MQISLFIVQAASDPNLSTLSTTDLQSLTAFIQFTNLDSCTSPSTMPDQVQYTLRMQEYVIRFFYISFYYLFVIDMVRIIIMLKMLKFHQMIIYGNVLLKIFVEVIHEENEYIF